VKTKLADHDQFMTTEEVLEYLQVNLRTVDRLIRRRNIPAIRVGRQWRFRRGDIEAWLETQRATAAQPATPPNRAPSRQSTWASAAIS
jgi:excisionase family DNA binding protein